MQSVLTAVPWLKPFLQWSFAAFVVVLVLAIPAYLLLPTARRFKTGVGDLLRRLRATHAKNLLDRKSKFETYVSQFAADRLLSHVDGSLRSFWIRTKSVLKQRTTKVSKALNRSRGAFEGFARSLPGLKEGFAKNLEGALPKEHDLPAISAELLNQTGNLLVARIMFVVTLMGIFVLIFINTGMLGQILHDLALVPPTMRFGTIPVYLLFACFITCVEGALGLVHGIASDSELSAKHPHRIPVGAWLAVAGGVSLACVEGMFYSRIIASRADTVTIPLVNFTVPQADVMFIWGFVLVMALFAVGHTCYSMFARAARGTATTMLRRQVKSVNRQMVRWTEQLRSSEAALDKVLAVVVNANAAVESHGVYSKLETLVVEMKALAESGPRWARVTSEPLEVSAVVHIARHALLWFFATTTAAVISVLTTFYSFWFLGYVQDRWLLFALAQCCVFIIGGMLLAWHETIEAEESLKIIAPMWGRTIGLALLGTCTIGYLVGFIHYGGSPFLWVANWIVLLAVAAATYQLTPLIGLLPIWAHWVFGLGMAAIDLIQRIMVWVVLIIATVVEEIISILAKPMELIFGRKSPPANPPALILERTKLVASSREPE